MAETRPVRVANFSGFFGDRRGSAKELLDGADPIDVLTGDYLAELTMLILWKIRQRDPQLGYAATFLDEMTDVLGPCLDRGVRVVANAGGLNPRGLAEQLHRLADRLGVSARIAVVEGDDLSGRVDDLPAESASPVGVRAENSIGGAGKPVTANAYLGGWGIAAALGEGADVVITGRVTDASLVVGPAAWWHGWGRHDWDRLAGAIVAGHIIECGPQATGGNYSFPEELPDLRYPGFPIAEIAADGSCVITKQPGTGGAVTAGTVTAQLLYEIGSPAYANPDATAHFDSIRLDQEGPDRVAVTGVGGTPPPDKLKVALNYPGGYRNTMTMVITGLDVERKAAMAEAMLLEQLGGRARFEEFSSELIKTGRDDAPSNPQATSLLRVTVKDSDPQKVGRQFSNAVTALSLASYGGFYTTTPPSAGSAFGVYRSTLVDPTLVAQTVTLPDGRSIGVAHTEGVAWPEPEPEQGSLVEPDGPDQPTRIVPLGTVCGARSGDKGGDANVGLWARNDEAFQWLSRYLTGDRLRTFLGEEGAGKEVRRYPLPNLRAVNFVIVGLLGAGVASSTRYDPQAKGLGEYIRSRLVPIPVRLLD